MKTLSRRQFLIGASSALALAPVGAWAHNHGAGHGAGHGGGHAGHGAHHGQGHAGHQAQQHLGHGAHHDGMMAHGTEVGRQGKAANVTRTFQIDMNDAMQFLPNKIEIKAGETVRFFVRNTGQQTHEFVIGTMKELVEHAKMMKDDPHMDHKEPNMITLGPRQRGAVIWHFDKPGTYYFGCLLPGHFEAGMKGEIIVK